MPNRWVPPDGPRRAISYCQDEVWGDPWADIRLFGVLRRGSPEWKALYSKRQTIERIFKSMKQSRRLERKGRPPREASLQVRSDRTD